MPQHSLRLICPSVPGCSKTNSFHAPTKRSRSLLPSCASAEVADIPNESATHKATVPTTLHLRHKENFVCEEIQVMSNAKILLISHTGTDVVISFPILLIFCLILPEIDNSAHWGPLSV
jgi:hypothetical protein